ncbi:MAG: winged helix-turn-helix transcriptional regulator [Rhodospirillales bacterium]|nr:winged helix-turn-helix transcriptional regulator [Rhodospirillales bacterium]
MATSGDRPRDTAIMLGVLSAVERDSGITQRSLSSELGIALGLANGYLKRCVRKGLIKVTQAPLNRYAYYLTPKGFAEKSLLTREYLTVSFTFFRDARRACTELFAECHRRGQTRLALAGAGELAEVAVLSATEAGVKVVCVIDPRGKSPKCAGRPVVASFMKAFGYGTAGQSLDAIVVTDTTEPQATYDNMIRSVSDAGYPETIVVAPSLLRISRCDMTRPQEKE